MKAVRRRFLTLAILGPLLVPVGESVSFAPADGSQAKKIFQIDADFALDDFSLVVDGNDIAAMIGGLDLSGQSTTEVIVTDVYLASGDGRALALSRTFDSLGSSFEMSVMAEFGGDDQEFSSSSELEGRTVLFTWDEEDEEYDVEFDDDSGDDELLDGLVEDMDLRAFLPGQDVDEGDSWEVDLLALGALIAPGGNLRLLPDDADVDMAEFEGLEDLFTDSLGDIGDLLEGSCECVLTELSEDDGDQLAEIGIKMELRSDIDLSELILEAIDLMAEEFGEAPEIDLENADLAIEFEVDGILIWNLRAGRAQSLELDGEAVISLDLAVSAELGGEGGTAEFFAEISAQFTQSVTIAE